MANSAEVIFERLNVIVVFHFNSTRSEELLIIFNFSKINTKIKFTVTTVPPWPVDTEPASQPQCDLPLFFFFFWKPLFFYSQCVQRLFNYFDLRFFLYLFLLLLQLHFAFDL